MLQHQSGRIHYLETFIKQRKKLFERLADIIRDTKENCFTGFIFQSHQFTFFFCWFLNSHSYKVILSLLQLYFTKQLHNLTALSPDLSKNKQTSSWKHVTFPVKFFVLACKIHLLFKFLKLPCSHLTLNKQQQKKAKPKHSCFFHQSSSSLRILHITSFQKLPKSFMTQRAD